MNITFRSYFFQNVLIGKIHYQKMKLGKRIKSSVKWKSSELLLFYLQFDLRVLTTSHVSSLYSR